MSRQSDGGFSDQFGGSHPGFENEITQDCFQIYGMHFCGFCRNLLTPSRENGEKLEFFCSGCETKEVDFTNLRDSDCIIYNKELKPGSRRSGLDRELALDPTMPRIKMECEDCGHDTMVYIVNADESQSYLNISLICENGARGRCDHIGELQIDKALFKGVAMDRQDFKNLMKKP